ncbi:MAG: (4Fe-4S)-binding protein [Microthrixaceae bacterium]
MPQKDYTADGIVIHWDSDRCIHSANCLNALPAVFDTAARPWIQPGEASADQLAAAVDQCPSRGLTYTRTDGGADGPGARIESAASGAETSDGEAAVTIHVKPAGPLAVTGPVQVVDAEGRVVASGERVFLCRCGQSARKPTCDGSHKRTGFTG